MGLKHMTDIKVFAFHLLINNPIPNGTYAYLFKGIFRLGILNPLQIQFSSSPQPEYRGEDVRCCSPIYRTVMVEVPPLL